ncbi:conserved Plasmodium protein, unknown function [Plasmodium gallinaceum]|uniref:Uncharacterized protein n=1 Tax=Plasmodium gallinaceum TaxID=5849 RepID=A0A1J1GNX5_PLAGA|nr:conserved Plasmodium protein, unknown function [Plasmodium gallinaceum]CRG92983.1 conserved Plasmodium protein, unknown function [Plasmodium gallinaceum]
MLRNKFLFIFLVFLNIVNSKKIKNILSLNFLSTFNENLNNDNFFFSYKKKNKINKKIAKHKFGEHFIRCNKRNVNLNYSYKKKNDKEGKIILRESVREDSQKDNDDIKKVEKNYTPERIEELNKEDLSVNKQENEHSLLNYNNKNELEKEIISEKIENQKNEIIKKSKLPIIGTQLKPSGGFTKELLNIIRESNDYINVINQEIIKDKVNKKLSGNDLSYFDNEETLEEHEFNYLNKIYDNNHVLNMYNFLLVWKKKKNIDLSVFVSKITENSNIMPGERTVIKFSEIEKVQYLKKIKKNRNVCIAMIFVDNKNNNNDESVINHNMFPIGIMAHPLDISLLDKSGEISVLNLFRFKINNYNVTENDFLVNCDLFIDNMQKLNNFELTQENKKIIMNLYDKILDLKIKYNEKIGKTHENEKLKYLEKITDRIDEYVNVLSTNKSIDFRSNKLNFFTSLYLEYFSFLSLDIHANIQTKLQMMYTDNTELRLHNVKTFLMQIYDDLKYKLKVY